MMVTAQCVWCEKPFRPRRGGSPQRFCSGACRTVFWSALRRWGEAALTAGTLTIDAVRNADPAACTLAGIAKAPRPVSELGLAGSAAPRALARFTVEVPQALIRRLGDGTYGRGRHSRQYTDARYLNLLPHAALQRGPAFRCQLKQAVPTRRI
jgi:hypothetical protein